MSMHCSQSCSLQNSWISFRLEKGQSSGKHQSHQSVSAAANATVNWNCLLLRLLSKVLWGLLLPSYWVDLSLPPVTGQPGAFLQAGYYPRPGIQFPASEGDISHAMLPSVQAWTILGGKNVVLIMFASHLWLAKYLMLINSLILSVSSGRKVHVKSCLLPSKGYEFEAQMCTGNLSTSMGNPENWPYHFEVSETNIWQLILFFFPLYLQDGSPLHSHQSETLIGKI